MTMWWPSATLGSTQLSCPRSSVSCWCMCHMGGGVFLDFDMLCSTVIFPWYQCHRSLFLWVLLSALPLLLWYFCQTLTVHFCHSKCCWYTAHHSLLICCCFCYHQQNGSHLSTITILHGTILFLYCVPNSKTSRLIMKVASVFYTVVIPTLNSLIYSLRNKYVKDIVSKIFDIKIYFEHHYDGVCLSHMNKAFH